MGRTTDEAVGAEVRAGETLDVVLPLGGGGALARPGPRVDAPVRLAAFGHAPGLAVLARVRIARDGVLDAAALRTRLAAPGAELVRTLAEALAVAEMDRAEGGLVFSTAPFNESPTGGLVDAFGLGALPDDVRDAFGRRLVATVDGCVRAAALGPRWRRAARRVVLMDGETLEVRIDAGAASLGRAGEPPVVCVGRLGTPAPRRFTVPCAVDGLCVDADALGALLAALLAEGCPGAALAPRIDAAAVGVVVQSAPEGAGTGFTFKEDTMTESNDTTTRTLRRIVLPEAMHDAGDAPVRRGLYVDCETTGGDWARDAVVELGLLPFTYTAEGRIVGVAHAEAQAHLSDPGRALRDEVAARTGLTAQALRARHIDTDAASALIERSDLLVAHNARFDRPFFERVLPATRDKPWACSRLEIPWRAAGTPSDALHCLLCHYGAFARARHRALADCEAGVWLLAQVLPGTGRRALAALLERSEAETVRLWALDSPRRAAALLRARGYRWMPEARRGIPRAWWTELAPEMVEAERAWLREAVYRPYRPAYVGNRGVFVDELRRVSARERWRADPTDCPAPPNAIDWGA